MKRISLIIIIALVSKFNLANGRTDTSLLKPNPGLYSLLISKNDKIVYERYFEGKDKATLFNDQSLTKSIMSLLIGIAIDKGYIKSADEKLVNFFPQMKSDRDKRKQQITLRQVMNQASGLYHENLEQLGAWLSIADPSGYVIKLPLETDPGKVFHYSNAASHLLSVILTKSTHMNTRAFADKFLFGPMNIKGYEWMKMRDGYYDGAGLLSIRLRTADIIKLGTLILYNGRYNNRKLVSPKWINTIDHPTLTYHTLWGIEGSEYALCWYHKAYKGVPITYALGWGGQFLIIIPSMQTVVAINQSVEDTMAIKRANNFLYNIFPLIFNELQQEKPFKIFN